MCIYTYIYTFVFEQGMRFNPTDSLNKENEKKIHINGWKKLINFTLISSTDAF